MLTGRVTDNDARLRVTMDATFKYGTDWDDDGEDFDGITGGTDCDDDDDYRLTTTIVSTDSDCDDSGEASSTMNTGDCDDPDPNIKPGVSEIAGDEVDQNCDGMEICFADTDGDRYHRGISFLTENLACDGTGEADRSVPSGTAMTPTPRSSPTPPRPPQTASTKTVMAERSATTTMMKTASAPQTCVQTSAPTRTARIATKPSRRPT